MGSEPEKSHSNSSTLTERRASTSSLCSVEEEHRAVYDMVHCILLSTRDNVNFVNEVFHQVKDTNEVSVAKHMSKKTSNIVCGAIDELTNSNEGCGHFWVIFMTLAHSVKGEDEHKVSAPM